MRYYTDEDDTLLGLEQARKGRKPRRWSGSLSQRVRAFRRLPQAVFKISSYSRSGGAVWDRVQYVSREGELEDEAGKKQEDLVELGEMVEKWEEHKGVRTKRIAMGAVVSFLDGVDQGKPLRPVGSFSERLSLTITTTCSRAIKTPTSSTCISSWRETRGHETASSCG